MIEFGTRTGVFAGDLAVDMSAHADSFARTLSGLSRMWMITKDVVCVANLRH
jgi:hypothetical protein